MIDEIATKLLNKIVKTKESAYLWAGFLMGFVAFKLLNLGVILDSSFYGEHIIFKIFEIGISIGLVLLIPIFIFRGRGFKK